VGGIIGKADGNTGEMVITGNHNCADVMGADDSVGGITGILQPDSNKDVYYQNNVNACGTVTGTTDVHRVTGQLSYTPGAGTQVLGPNYADEDVTVVDSSNPTGTTIPTTDPEYGADKLHGLNTSSKPCGGFIDSLGYCQGEECAMEIDGQRIGTSYDANGQPVRRTLAKAIANAFRAVSRA